MATVISRRTPRDAVLDAGLKALAGAELGLPVPRLPGVRALSLSDEHLTVATDEDVDLRLGDLVGLLPRHLDPTMDLHDVVVAQHPDGRLEPWPVAARSSLARRVERQAAR